jgi:hypothetical protein
MLARHFVERSQHCSIANAAAAHRQQELHATDAVVAYRLPRHVAPACPSGTAQSMMPKWENRLSGKVMLKQKARA